MGFNECYRDLSPIDSLGQNCFMNTSLLEEAILFAVGDRWAKVSMLIAKVANAMGGDLLAGDEACEVISKHIQVLVLAGRLEAQEDTKNWRFSEVRRLHSNPRCRVNERNGDLSPVEGRCNQTAEFTAPM